MDHKNNKKTNASFCLDDVPSHTNEGIISGISLFLRVSRNSGGFAKFIHCRLPGYEYLRLAWCCTSCDVWRRQSVITRKAGNQSIFKTGSVFVFYLVHVYRCELNGFLVFTVIKHKHQCFIWDIFFFFFAFQGNVC